MPSPRIYQLRIFLRRTRPPIWRRVLVRSSMRLDRLHHLIQLSMGWEDCHLHMFRKGRQIYSLPNPWDDDFRMPGTPRDFDARKFRIDELLQREKDWIDYIYDFGDSWEHKVTLQKILPPKRGVRLPACVGGKQQCPPEDCGGVWGYYEMLEVLKDPNHPDHDHFRGWVGEDFDPAEPFDPRVVDAVIGRCRW